MSACYRLSYVNGIILWFCVVPGPAVQNAPSGKGRAAELASKTRLLSVALLARPVEKGFTHTYTVMRNKIKWFQNTIEDVKTGCPRFDSRPQPY